jgi:hypothetical protein
VGLLSGLKKLKFKKVVSIHGVEKLAKLAGPELVQQFLDGLPALDNPLLELARQALEQEILSRVKDVKHVDGQTNQL